MDSQNAATKANLMAAQRSLRLAETGYELMDRKRTILVREILKLSDDAKELQNEISVKFASAYFALMRANITGGMSAGAAESTPIDRTLEIVNRSVMGVEIPEVRVTPTRVYPHYGLSVTTENLDEAYLRFIEVKELTARLAQTECSIRRLAGAIKKTRKRTNALGNLMIPTFRERIRFISQALEEKEREEFTRLKVIKRGKDQ